MKISTSDLLSLPAGAVYHKKEGRATIRAETRGDTVYIAGVCDSLAREVERYEELWQASQDKIKALESKADTTEIKPGRSPTKTFFIGLMLGVLLGAAIIIIINKRRKQ